MGDVLQEAADRLEAAATDISNLDAGDEIAAFLNNIAVALSSLSNAVNVAASAFSGELAQGTEITADQPEEMPPADELPPAEG